MEEKRPLIAISIVVPLLLFLLALAFPPSAAEKAGRVKPCFKSIESNRIRFVNVRSIQYASEVLEAQNTLYRHRAFEAKGTSIVPVIVHSLFREEVYIRFESKTREAVLECGQLSLDPDTGDAGVHWKAAYRLLRYLEDEEAELFIRTNKGGESSLVSSDERKAFVRTLEDYFRWTELNECP